jgi:hypothetical protein
MRIQGADMAIECMTPDNVAAVAKKMHDTALQVEQQIYEVENQLRESLNKPTIIQATTVNATGLAANTDHLIGPTFGGIVSTVFNNTSFPNSSPIANFDTLSITLGEGMYEVGFWCTAVASGVADAGTQRSFRIRHYTPDPSVVGFLFNGLRLVNEISYTLFESNVGGGVEIAISGHFRLRPMDRIFFTLFHQNTSSTLTVNAGAVGWVHKVSESSLTEVL